MATLQGCEPPNTEQGLLFGIIGSIEVQGYILSLYLSTKLFIYNLSCPLCIDILISLWIYLSLSISLSPYLACFCLFTLLLSIYISGNLFVDRSVCRSVYLSIYLYCCVGLSISLMHVLEGGACQCCSGSLVPLWLARTGRPTP